MEEKKRENYENLDLFDLICVTKQKRKKEREKATE